MSYSLLNDDVILFISFTGNSSVMGTINGNSGLFSGEKDLIYLSEDPSWRMVACEASLGMETHQGRVLFAFFADWQARAGQPRLKDDLSSRTPLRGSVRASPAEL